MKILDHRQIEQKIKRLAIEILEEHYDETSIILAGINNNGYYFAELIANEFQKMTDKVELVLTRISLNPADPLSKEIQIEMPVESLNNKVIVIVDDVANTGRTIFYAAKPLLSILPKRVEVAVLVDRTHKFFPVKVDYVGLSLATTLMEHIDVKIKGVENYEVLLN